MEFHDSYLQHSNVDAGGAILFLKAYVHQWEQQEGHWIGTGWYQPVRVTIGAPASGPDAEEELDIYHGCLTIDASVDKGMIPLPYSAHGQVELWLED